MSDSKSEPTLCIALADGSEEIEAVSVIDLCRRAKINVTVASVGSTKKVKCSRGVVIVSSGSV